MGFIVKVFGWLLDLIFIPLNAWADRVEKEEPQPYRRERPKVVVKGGAYINCRSDGERFIAIAPVDHSVSRWYDTNREAAAHKAGEVDPAREGEMSGVFWVTEGLQRTRSVRVCDIGFSFHKNIACLPEEVEELKRQYPNGKMK